MKFVLLALMLMLGSNAFGSAKLVLDQALPFYDIQVSSFEVEQGQAKEICESQISEIINRMQEQKVAIVQVNECSNEASVGAILLGLELYVGKVVLSQNEIIPTKEEVEEVLLQYESQKSKKQ